MSVRILIADDNSLVRSTLRQILKSPDYEILEAANGAEAVEKTLKLHPDVVILDLAMPVLDGLTAARQISTEMPDLPILLCTMYWSPQLHTEAERFGVRKVISKGEASALLSAISEMLDTPGGTVPEVLSPLVLPDLLSPPAAASSEHVAADIGTAIPDLPNSPPEEKAS